MEASHGKMSQKEFDDYSMPMALDLIAVFSLLQEEVLDLLEQADKEGWTPDILIKKVEELI
jgi:hypothetical protein